MCCRMEVRCVKKLIIPCENGSRCDVCHSQLNVGGRVAQGLYNLRPRPSAHWSRGCSKVKLSFSRTINCDLKFQRKAQLVPLFSGSCVVPVTVWQCHTHLNYSSLCGATNCNALCVGRDSSPLSPPVEYQQLPWCTDFHLKFYIENPLKWSASWSYHIAWRW
jgi:hypothetical protein